jgi:hypothetical protein
MKKWTALVAVVALMLGASTYAWEKDNQTAAGDKPKCGKTTGLAVGRDSGSVVSKVLAGLPKMTYKAGELETPCFKTATEHAGSESKVQYVVDGKPYGCKGQATDMLASLLEGEAEKMMTVQYTVGEQSLHCPMGAASLAQETGQKMTYRLAGFDFESKQEADAVAQAVREAVAKMAGDTDSAVATAAKPGCKPGCGSKASTVAAKPGCKPGCGSKANTVADKAEGSKTKAVALSAKPGCKPGCGSKAKTAADKPGCKPGCGSKATTVAAKSKAGCPPGCTKPCCPKTKTTAVAAGAKTGCPPGCSKPCCSGNAQTVAGAAQPAGCPQGNAAADCCAAAEKRLQAVMAKLHVIVETGAKAQSS